MAHRRRRLDRRGRPRKIGARRRQTTVAGRQGEPDHGTRELRRRKCLATTREDLEVSPIGVLFGHQLIDATQYDTLALVAASLRRLAHNLGPKPNAVEGLWQALIGAAISGSGLPLHGVGPAADQSRRVLGRMLRRLDGSRELVLQLAEDRPPPLIIRVLEQRLARSDELALARLRHDLDRVAGRR